MNNLKAEMARNGIKCMDIQLVLGCADKTVRNKLSGKTVFTIPEAFKIRNALFPNVPIEYLFASDSKPTNGTRAPTPERVS